MITATLAHIPRKPHSEFEWEDLLVRLELMPRALRITLEAIEGDLAGLSDVLNEVAERERVVGRLLEVPAAAAELEVPSLRPPASTGEVLERFVRLRARNFAMVQRRGLEVWGWEATLEDGSRVTVHQLLAHLVHEDVAALAAIRRLTAAGTGAC